MSMALSILLLSVLILKSSADAQSDGRNEALNNASEFINEPDDTLKNPTRDAQNDGVAVSAELSRSGALKDAIELLNEPDDPVRNPIHPAQNDVIAFSAELSGDAAVAPGGTVVFDRTITNVGELYLNTSGQFACPEGVFVFTWNIRKQTSSYDGMRCIGSLHSGGVDRKYGPKTSDPSPSASSGVSQMTAILECDSNPPIGYTAVTITAKPWAGIADVSVFYSEFTTFSGFKLHAGIAFSAELSTDLFAFPGARIQFDKVLANVGGYYDVISSVFRCPDAGVYVFDVSTHTPDPSTPWSVSRLMMEGEVVMQGPMTYVATDDYDSGSASTTTVLQCTPGYSVYVDAQAAHDIPHNSYGAELTSFTGFKLYDITPEAVAFTVVLSQNYSEFAVVPFDEVITNIGGAFDVSSSSFVCPDDSYYLFTWTAVTTGSRNIDLHMDGSSVKRSRTNNIGSNPGTTGSCTQSVILQCQVGSFFHVVYTTSSPLLLGGYTSFSGYKLPG